MKRDNRNLLKGLAFISPWIIGFAVFQLYPICASIYYSFCHYDVLREPVFTGLDNYQSLLNDPVFIKSLISTIIYAVLSVPLCMFVSLFFALLLNQKVVGRGIFRALYFLPSLIPLVAVSVLWAWVFNGKYGVLNYVLGLLHIPGPNWLGSTFWATPAIAMTSAWGVGGSIVIYLAALQDVPASLYEAAEIDGANWLKKLFNVTLPMISPAIYFNLIIGIIGALQVFAQPYIMTGGGPARSTYYYTLYLFENAFRYLRMGYASTMAIVMFLIILGITVLTSKLVSKKIHYA